jgi:cytochrome c-type biogenesis protein CcmH
VHKYLTAILLAAAFSLAQAGEAQSLAVDPVLEEKVQGLAEVLRCLVCQNQNLADSHADLAIDLKNQVREMLKQGKSEKEVIDYMVARYGDFVLYKPPLKGTTWLLWGGPFMLFGGGLGALYLNIRRRRKEVAMPLNDGERATAMHMLSGEVEGSK